MEGDTAPLELSRQSRIEKHFSPEFGREVE